MYFLVSSWGENFNLLIYPYFANEIKSVINEWLGKYFNCWLLAFEAKILYANHSVICITISLLNESC